MKTIPNLGAVVALSFSLCLSAQQRPENRSSEKPAVGCLQRVGEGFVLLSADGNFGLLGGEEIAEHTGETVKVTGRRAAGDITVETIETVRADCDDADQVKWKKESEGGDGLTADDQGGSKADRETTAKIRRALVEDESLSTLAHNVKIITRDGRVTLRGRVQSAAEKTAVQAKVEAVAGDADVDNQLTVKGERKSR